MSNEIDYEAAVKKVWPLSCTHTCIILGKKYYMVLLHKYSCDPISDILPSFFSAWRNAYERLKTNK